jgi:hypothetical protein
MNHRVEMVRSARQHNSRIAGFNQGNHRIFTFLANIVFVQILFGGGGGNSPVYVLLFNVQIF